jgi:endoglucanase
MGEFGPIIKADPESRHRWISFVVSEAESRNIGWLYWSFCSNFGLYDCEESVWNQIILEDIIQP